MRNMNASVGQERLGKRIDLMEMLTAFPEEFVRDKIIPNLNALQLTHGCSGGCSFCSEASPPLGGGYFSYESMEAFVEKYQDILSIKSFADLYMASNPLDYHDGDYDYYNVATLFGDKTGAYSILTNESTQRFLEHAKTEIANKSLKRTVAISDLGRSIDIETKEKFHEMLVESGIKEQSQIEAIIEEYFMPRTTDSIEFRYMSTLGRNYKPSLDFFKSRFTTRNKEGIEITPGGINGVINTYPTPSNQTGRLVFPVRNNQAPIVELGDARVCPPLEYCFDNSGDDLAEKLKISLGHRLHDELVLREAYSLRSLSGFILSEYPGYEDNVETEKMADAMKDGYIKKRTEHAKNLLLGINKDKCSKNIKDMIPDIEEMIRRMEKWEGEFTAGNYKTALVLYVALYFNPESRCLMHDKNRDQWKSMEQQAYKLGKGN